MLLTLIGPAPVGVNDDRAADVGAGVCTRALLPRERRVSLGGVGTSLLGRGRRNKRESNKREHCIRVLESMILENEMFG
jgi:hypothetical protein